MKNLNFWRSTRLTTMILLAAGCAAGGPSKIEERIVSPKPAETQSGTAETGMPPNAPAARSGERSPGIVVHIDPNTGEFLPEPPHGAVMPPATPGVAVPPPQLFEVPSAVLGGAS